MFYGGLQDDKLQRPLQKHYCADGSMEIKRNTQTGEVEFITYIGGDAYSSPLVLKSDGTAQDYLFLHRDYQGTILAITDEQGTVIEKRLFDAWGLLVKVQDQYGNVLDKMMVLDRGYTGHEHLQSIGIVHMNGRLYDAKLHRFLQPDNFVQDPYNTQNYNRYGYVLNNPLKYTDPSGEFFIGSILSAIVDGVKNIFTHGVNVGSYDWTRTQNAWKIDMGLWQGNIGQILNRFTSEDIQTNIGYMVNTMHNVFGGVKNVSYYNEATIVETYSENWGAFTLGSYIMGQRKITNNPNDYLFQHEYGHVLQSQYSGKLYLTKYALPSLFSDGNHNLYWTETDANVRAYTYFSTHDSNFKTWHFVDRRGGNVNPIPGYDPSKPFDDPVNQMALESNTSNLTKFESFFKAVLGSFNYSPNSTPPSDMNYIPPSDDKKSYKKRFK